MNRERRCCARNALDTEILIGYSQSGFVRARARDISLGGLGVETNASFPLDRPVEIIFRAPANGTPRTHRWRATVKHVAPDGAGLKYEPFVLTELPALLWLLQVAEHRGLECAEKRTGLGFRSDADCASSERRHSVGVGKNVGRREADHDAGAT